MIQRIISSTIKWINPYDHKRYNDPVNLDNVTTMSTGCGSKDYNKCFDITFNFACGDSEIWLYTVEKERDKDWKTINELHVLDLGGY
jgi:hypothetical protein